MLRRQLDIPKVSLQGVIPINRFVSVGMED
jgi:hypothetical protein